MISLTDHIKVTVIRTAAGVRTGPIGGGCWDSAPTYFIGGHLSLELPEGCGNFRTLYDPSAPRKVINVMNFCGAPSSEYFPFDHSNLVDPIDLQCELEAGDDVIFLWKPLYAMRSELWFTNSKVRKSTPAPAPAPAHAPVSAPQTNQQPSDVAAQIVNKNPSSSPLFRFVRLK